MKTYQIPLATPWETISHLPDWQRFSSLTISTLGKGVEHLGSGHAPDRVLIATSLEVNLENVWNVYTLRPGNSAPR